MQKLAKGWKAQATPMALVPTMGYLHEGHISLVHRARKLAGQQGRVVVSIYVNPTQFAPTEDLAKYPRDLKRDLRLCREAGVDVIFTPTDEEMYPQPFSTFVSEERLSRGMEGASRPTHFRGVTTVVAKLFNITLPDVAVFGAKDFQQAAVIRKMTCDLNFPVKIVVAPTVREADGLAMSSRNKYLSAADRPPATVLFRAPQLARKSVAQQPVASGKLNTRIAERVSREPSARLDYVEFFNPDTLEPVAKVRRGDQMALAVFIGKTRLIDNGSL